MEDILAFVFELVCDVAEALLLHGKYKSTGSRTRTITVFYSVFAVLLVGGGIFLTADALRNANTVAAWVVGGMTLLTGGLVAFGIIRGHRKNWQSGR